MKPTLQLCSAVVIFSLTLTAPAAVTHYVSPTSPAPASPFMTWDTAATNIQDAIDAATDGDEILVTNGVYATGGRAVYGTMTNRVVIDKPVILRSVNGPNLTFIVGQGVGDGGTNNGYCAVRCVYLGFDAFLSGFTLTNGHTQATGDSSQEQSGGGAWCEDSGTISNCTFISNSAECNGGGTHSGTLHSCIIIGNAARSGYGGGAYYARLTNCTLSGNLAFSGGGACSSTFDNCIVTRNLADGGGGTRTSSLNNCTVTGNSADTGGGVLDCSLNNCIVFCNTALTGANYSGSAFYYSCTTPLPPGIGNIDTNPSFINTNNYSNLRLQSNSPCINVGNNEYVLGSTDLDGNPRIIDGTVDMGAYEFQGFAHYVNVNNANPKPPYSTWDIAATNIQDAIDAATDGDEILVTNGVYATGGRAVYGTMTNRVVIDKAVTVRSVNGPDLTFISGALGQGPYTEIKNGDGAIRCVYVGTNAMLSGFTLTNGHTRTTGDEIKEMSGGGAWCESSGVLTNCTFTSNSSGQYGGGIYSGTLKNCRVTGNSAVFGGGAYDCNLAACILMANDAHDGGGAYLGALTNCTLTGNSARAGAGANSSTLNNCIITGNSAGANGGGVCGGTLKNSIVYYNAAPENPNYFDADISFSCTTPLPSGTGNITTDPIFVDTNGWANLRLQSTSPCINAGNNAYVTCSADLDGNPRIVFGAVDIGAYEFQGDFRYVNASNPNPQWPYETWENAATNIQDALDTAVDGQIILVTNGVYATGGRPQDGTLTNRVLIDKAVTVQSVNGPDLTIIVGQGDSERGTDNGDGAIRCVYVGPNAVLSGFTLTNGHTQTHPHTSVTAPYIETSGGGAYCACSAVLTNCILTGNAAFLYGGGAFSGVLNNCILTNNTVYWLGGGAADSFLTNCTISSNSSIGYVVADFSSGGGGAYSSTLKRCILTGNSTTGTGGGIYGGMSAEDCVFSGNSAHDSGGGASQVFLHNCTLTGNSAQYGGGAYNATLNNCTVCGNSGYVGCGAYESTLNNCIFYYNEDPDYRFCSFTYSCTTYLEAGRGNIDSPPLFVNTNDWSDLRLKSNSPCINAGKNSYASGSTDLDGNPRIAGGTVDIGAYEFQTPASTLSYTWLQQYELPTDGSADTIDSDADGLNNFQEWRAGTNPTNAASVLRLLTPQTTNSNILLQWQAVANVNYFLQRSTNLTTFEPVATNLTAYTGPMTYTDTNPPPPPLYYRLGVSQ